MIAPWLCGFLCNLLNAPVGHRTLTCAIMAADGFRSVVNQVFLTSWLTFDLETCGRALGHDGDAKSMFPVESRSI